MWFHTTIAFIILGLLQIHAEVHAQKITIQQENISLDDAFSEINRQTGYQFLWMPTHLKSDLRVEAHLNNADLNDALTKLLKNLPLDYEMDGKVILIRERIKASSKRALPADNGISSSLIVALSEVQGKVVDTLGQPLAGASVRVKGYKLSTMTASNGTFILENVPQDAMLECSYMGYISREVPAQAQVYIVLKPSESPLDAVQVIAYGTTSKRYTTSSVTTVTAAEIEKQPVSNVLQTLAGKVPGLKSFQMDGLPGGWFDLNIRGENSLGSGTRPLILVDGIPFSNTSTATRFPGTNSYNSPLNVLNTNDIQSVEVLKDADATAIYGSRGSNGVILIITKKGRIGKPRLNAQFYTGVTTATRFAKMLNTQQYIEMRKEAFANDGIVPDASNAPDLVLWDTTKYTDWNKLYRTGNGISKNLQLDYSGGNETNQFRIGYGYHRESPLYSKVRDELTGNQTLYNKHAIQLSFSNHSLQDKLQVSVNAGYNLDFSNFGATAGLIVLPPNAPDQIDKDGNLYWLGYGVGQTNPIATLFNIYDAKNKLLTASTNLSFEIIRGLRFKVNGGYNTLDYKDVYTSPKSMYPVNSGAISKSNFTRQNVNSWQVEPYFEYNRLFNQHEISFTAGETWHRAFSDIETIAASNYRDEAFVGSLYGAATMTVSGGGADYTYHGVYGRLSYNWMKKWFLNLTARRDGSSRFGPGKRYSNFGAIGMAYIFTEEPVIKRILPQLSFGKFRANYGITGNDGIGDFLYEDLWSNYQGFTYEGANVVYPSRLFNADLKWEKNKKMELALDLGFFDDRLLLATNYYRSIANDQLIGYTLPSQTGFSGITKNFEATVLNYGWEFQLSGTPVKSSVFNWNIDVNLSIARNKLQSFPGIESTSYASQYVVGKPITAQYYYNYLGVDTETGLYNFGESDPRDRTIFHDLNTPTFYGGLTNSLSYKGWSFEAFFQFSKQDKRSYLFNLTYYPGYIVNQPVEVLDRWRQPGDQTDIQKFTAGFNTDATKAMSLKKSSLGTLEDASFIRIKNVSVSYTLPKNWLKHTGLSKARIYFEGQNLGVLTGYKGMDPESAGLGNPLIRVFTGGVDITF